MVANEPRLCEAKLRKGGVRRSPNTFQSRGSLGKRILPNYLLCPFKTLNKSNNQQLMSLTKTIKEHLSNRVQKGELNTILIANITLVLFALQTKKKQKKYYITTILEMGIDYAIGAKQQNTIVKQIVN